MRISSWLEPLRSAPRSPPNYSAQWDRLQPVIPIGRSAHSLNRLGVDQDEGNPAILVATVGPGMIGAALNQDVARPHQGLPLVEHGPDLSLEHDGVIDRAGLMEHGMPWIAFIYDMSAAHLFHHLAHVGPLEDLVGREVDNAKNRATAGRLDAQLPA